jgi:phospholipase D1/2
MGLDQAEATAVRMIMEAQYWSICRGDTSIFARLRAEGIDPDEYITFFSLRAWGRMKSGNLVTQDVSVP